MNKQEMAEWLAENVLGAKFEMFNEKKRWIFPTPVLKGIDPIDPYKLWNEHLVIFIYSPNGFFAVWDAVEKMGICRQIAWYNRKKENSVRCDFNDDVYESEVGGMGEGKDRYESFYNAVYEAMEDE